MGGLSLTAFRLVPFNFSWRLSSVAVLRLRKLVVKEQTESWQLRSGTWYRDPKSERWRLAMTPNGTVANAKLSTQDVGRMIGAKRDTSSGQWFPSDFNYSPQTGTRLHVTITSLDSPWVPPYGAPALSDIAKPLARGLRQTPAPLALARSNGRFDPAQKPCRLLRLGSIGSWFTSSMWPHPL